MILLRCQLACQDTFCEPPQGLKSGDPTKRVILNKMGAQLVGWIPDGSQLVPTSRWLVAPDTFPPSPQLVGITPN